jgi:hypothetical protein
LNFVFIKSTDYFYCKGRKILCRQRKNYGYSCSSIATCFIAGTGCPTVLIGFLPAWRGVNPAAAAALQAANTAATVAIKAAEAASVAPLRRRADRLLMLPTNS